MAKGLFTPKNPHKYIGDPRKIRFLSSWELRMMQMCDANPAVIRWGSEEFRVKYFNPIKKQMCQYIPDFIITYRDRDGKEITEVVEVKPAKEAVIGRRKKISAYDAVQLTINHAKWEAASRLCEAHGIKFRVITEHEMFRQGSKR